MSIYGYLDYDNVYVINLNDELIDEIKTQIEENDISEDDDPYDLLDLMAYRKGCKPNKNYYCAFLERYRHAALDEVLEEINFYNTCEEAVQDLGAIAEIAHCLDWNELTDDQIQTCYEVVVEYKKIIDKKQ